MNNRILLLVSLFSCFTSFAQSEETITLNEALKKKMISISGEYNPNSVHYLKPVLLTLVSLIDRPFKIKIEPGNLMEPEDSNCQTMMVTNAMIVKLDSRKSKETEPFAMCIEPEDGSGRKGLKYKFALNKNKQLIEIAQFINDNKFKDGIGQQAVWCVADKKRNLLQINGYDSVSRLKLITKVATILGKPVPDAKLLREAYSTYTEPTKTETIGGMFEFKFSETSKVHIAMFDARGILVRELYYNANEKPGIHKVDFEFDYTVYTDEYYDIKLIADDEVMLTSRVDRNDDNWIAE